MRHDNPGLQPWELCAAGIKWLVLAAICVISMIAFSLAGTGCSDTASRERVVAAREDRSATAAPSVRYETYRIVREYPHDARAYTQGLAYADGVLYEGTGRYGLSSLRKVELETGKVLKQVDLSPSFFGEGITLLNGKVYQLTWRSQTGFVYDLASFERLGRFQYPTQGWGLTHDGTHLIMSDGSARLYYLHPETFAQTRVLEVHDANGPVDQLNELEYINGEIYANVWHRDDIVRISPETGAVVGRIDMSNLIDPARLTDPEAVLNGIAYDAATDRLFVTGKLWPALFEIRVIPK